jgi:cytochrome c oxidase assembly protein subunit 15
MQYDGGVTLHAARLSSLTAGFAITVAVWGVGYLGRLPELVVPSPVLVPALLGCMVGGGVLFGRRTGLGWRHGALAGLVSGALNLLVLGSFLIDPVGGAVPSALVWIPGSLVATAALVGAGAAAGTRRSAPVGMPLGHGTFAWVAVGAAAFLLGVGGVVTSAEAGLAVVDWPNSFGYNMFLYPFSRMTGPIYYEHTHRLFGALVGLTTVTLALVTSRSEPRRRVRAACWMAVGMVVIQGVLGGLRVTGGFTWSLEPADMTPSLTLAMVHGILGQVFFGTLVCLAVVTSRTWAELPAARSDPGGSTERWLSGALVGLILVQLVLGAARRHGVHPNLLLAHVGLGIAAVTPLAVHVGFRAWGRSEGTPVLQRAGLFLAGGVGTQLLLGLAAFAVTAAGRPADALQVAVTPAHQWLGAILLGLAVAIFTLCFRVSFAPRRPVTFPGEPASMPYIPVRPHAPRKDG